MQVPRLPVTGENFKKYAIDTLKAIIAYLHASRVRPGKGIRVEETPCGTVISIIPRGSAIQGGAGGITYEAGTGITITGGTPGVPEKINANIVGGSDISVTGGTNGNPLVISYVGGGGGGGGVPFPDYSLLTDSSDVPADVPGIGTTYLLPVRAGVAIKYATDGTNVFAKYAPGIGTTGGSAQLLTKDVSYTPGANGWVRIRVFDNGVDNGKCLRFFSGGVDWSGALPLYKYGTFDNGGGGGGEGDFEGYTTQIEASYLTVPVAATEYIDASVDTHYIFSFEDFITVGSSEYYNCYWNSNGKFKTPFGADSGVIYNYYSSGQGYGRELKLPSPDTGGVIEVDTFVDLGNIIVSSTSTICNEDGTINSDWTDYGLVYISSSSRVLFIAHPSEHAWYMKISY